jgi:hypothetical protein
MTNLRGFALLKAYNPSLMQQIASKGGRAATNRHKWTREQAIAAGKKARANEKEKKGEDNAAIPTS